MQASSASSSSTGSMSGQIVPMLPLPSSPNSTARSREYSDTELELNEEECLRVVELSKITYNKPLPPPPVSVTTDTLSRALPPPPVNAPPIAVSKMARSPSTMANLNKMLGHLVSPAAIFKIDGSPNGKKMSIYPRPAYTSFQDQSAPPKLTAVILKQQEDERQQQAKAFDAVKAIIQQQKSVEELYAELHSLYLQNRLIPLLPHILPLLPPRRVVDDLVTLSCIKTEKDTPFRSETPGITIFCYELMPELEKVLGKRAIGTIAYSVICSSMKLGKYLTTPRGEVLPSPKEKVIEQLYKFFMQSLAERLSGSLGAKAPQIAERMGFLLSILRKQSYGFYSSERKRQVAISPENLLLNLFILRFVNPEVYQGYILLKDDDDPVNREVANYFRVLTREVQKRTNLLIDDGLVLTHEQELILRSLLTL